MGRNEMVHSQIVFSILGQTRISAAVCAYLKLRVIMIVNCWGPCFCKSCSGYANRSQFPPASSHQFSFFNERLALSGYCHRNTGPPISVCLSGKSRNILFKKYSIEKYNQHCYTFQSNLIFTGNFEAIIHLIL